MNDIKTIQGITNIYDSAKTKEFDNAQNYPIAWEVIFINDKTGNEFSLNTIKAFKDLPKEQGYIIDFQSEDKDPVHCLECVFNSKDAFKRILNETLKGITFFDEKKQAIQPKFEMLKDAGKVLTAKMELAI